MPITRRRLHFRGVVQGVGFRPHVYSLALRHGLTGFVGNDAAGVFIEIQGEQGSLDLFVDRLQATPPPLARIESVAINSIGILPHDSSFVILQSKSNHVESTSVSPDIATCDDCLREMLDPADRRYRYPFINCTNCGPRFTIIRSTPYDRSSTTMQGFNMCRACQDEYDDPSDRRFHAQPNACRLCGPELSYLQRGAEHKDEQAISAAQNDLAQGRIVAIKGIGGFHLAVDATNADAVLRLRERKRRPGKPLAVMARDLDMVRQFAILSKEECDLLISPQRPIVLLQVRADEDAFPFATEVAPGTDRVGVMLPYSGLHVLLMQNSSPLVMTSGNLSSEPILWRNEDALERLAGIADAFLLHNRDIHVPCDDSVIRICDGHEAPVRRSRGYAPLPVGLRSSGPSVLAVGAELKSTFCLTQRDHAYLSQHLGDMENLETLTAFEQALEHFQSLFRTRPEVVACDAHPGYLSSSWARRYSEREGVPLVEVQHHHSHLCSTMAEHGLDGSSPILGVVFDGTGYGTDGAIWGGEILKATYTSFERILHLGYTPMPGGEASIRNPYRMALAHLWSAGIPWSSGLPCVDAATETDLSILQQQLSSNLLCVPTSSMGRFFDAAASLIGVRHRVEYEAQAAIELEAVSDDLYASRAYPVRIQRGEIDPRPVIRAIVDDIRSGASKATLAGRFQRTVVQMIVNAAEEARRLTDIGTVALTGGVMQNMRIAGLASLQLREHGFRVLEHRLVPANDGGIALGQATIALARQRNA